MAAKEERFIILEDEVSSRYLIAEVMENGFLVTDSRHAQPKPDLQTLSEKHFEANKKEGPLLEIQSNTPAQVLSCAVCQFTCNSCKSICVTCKSPCRKCNKQSCKNFSTDTDDFDKYLESQFKKVKPPVKIKTVGTDTCDLEGHFDYYKSEKKVVKILKHVATDCIDLNVRKTVVKKPVKNSVGVDTSDLILTTASKDLDDDSDLEFFWNSKDETKTYVKKPARENSSHKEDRPCDDEFSENSLVIDEDVSVSATSKEENIKPPNITSSIITFDGSTSEDSDVDLATSCKISKCRKLAKEHNITLKQVTKNNETSYECSICGEISVKKRKAILHLGNHIESNFFKCLRCDDKFDNIDLLFSHVKEKHESVVTEKSEIENKENTQVDISKIKMNKIYQCTYCPPDAECVTFESYKALNVHKKEVHGIERTKENDGEKTERKPRIKREFICLICGKQFKSSKALKDHAPVHTGEKNYQCDICKKSYTTSSNLKIHKRIHTGAKNFVCSVCGKAFHKKDSLKVHFRKHSGERPFQCDLCPMKFDRNYILKNHRYTHFSEKKFICPVCGKTFTTHGGLNNHEKGHKKDPFAKKPRKPAVKPTLDTENAVICDVCGKIYSTRSNLRIHKFVHLGVKPFECKICHQTYAKKYSMLTHMRKHTDERPFACETCGMTFYRNHTLKTHQLRHTGERPHKCKMCGKSFTQSSSLAYHLKNHDKKSEKKKILEDPNKVKKKRLNQGNKIGRTKKIQKLIKHSSEVGADDPKPIFANKKPVEGATDIAILKNPIPLNLPNKEELKGIHFMVQDKEILIVDKNVGVEHPRIVTAKDQDFYTIQKEISYSGSSSIVNGAKLKKDSGAKEEVVENLIISKNSYITKEGNLVTLNGDSSLKEVKEFLHIGDERLDLKAPTAIPITGEILNAAFISEENGDVIPLSSMNLQGISTENIMISPLVPVEGDDRKGFLRSSKMPLVESKIAYNLASGGRIFSDKIQSKGNYHIINLKDSRAPQKVQIELESPTLIHAPVDDSTIHSVPTYYSNIQQNEM